MNRHNTLSNAFTLLEVVFAIVILGIVASISSQMIVQVYQSYIMQKSVHNASIKTELAINQLANRLTYRIDRSMLARKLNQTGLTSNDVYPAAEVPISEVNNYPILEWIGYDGDSLEAPETPAWSGYCDLGRSSFASLITPGSDVSDLSKFTYYGNSRAVVFTGLPAYRMNPTPASGYYKAQCMYQQNGCIFPVSSSGTDTLTFTTGKGDRVANDMRYTEFYRLAASAFAVVPTNPHAINNVNVWDLELHYGYQPWNGDNYLTNANNRATLLRNVSVFRFGKEANSIRIKLCVVEPTAIGDQISICKEKAVIR